MRRFFALVAAALFCAALWGCVVHQPAGGARYQPRGRGRCYTTCAQYAQRQACSRRCSIWRGGVCIRYRQDCSSQRYCVRNVTRCH